MPQNPQKTKGEILSELESIKGLLLEDDIPILQDIEHQITDKPTAVKKPNSIQTSIFDELEEISLDENIPTITDVASHNPLKPSFNQPVKATGENPFLPQHIRDRLQGNNPPPIFDVGLTKKMQDSLKNFPKGHIENRHDLVNDLVKRYLPQIEQDLRLRLLAMTDEELKKL